MSKKQTIKRSAANAAERSEIPTVPRDPIPNATSTEPRENPAPPFSRAEIRSVSKRVMGSRQSERKLERSSQRRQPKRGPGSQRTSAG